MRFLRRVGWVWWVVLACLLVIVLSGVFGWSAMTKTPSREEVMIEVAKAQASAEAVAERLGFDMSEWESYELGCLLGPGDGRDAWVIEGFREDASTDAMVSQVEAAIVSLGGEMEGRWVPPGGVIVGARWPSGSRYSIGFELYHDGYVRFRIVAECYHDTTPRTTTTTTTAISGLPASQQ